MELKEQIQDYLQNHPEGLGPTSIGLALGFEYNVASARVNIPLQQLVKERFVTKNGSGRKVTYRLSKF